MLERNLKELSVFIVEDMIRVKKPNRQTFAIIEMFYLLIEVFKPIRGEKRILEDWTSIQGYLSANTSRHISDL